MRKAKLEITVYHQENRIQVRIIDGTDVNAEISWLQFCPFAAKITEVSTNFMKKLHSNITQKRKWGLE